MSYGKNKSYSTVRIETPSGDSVQVYADLTALQAALPSGSSSPVWVTSENAWYYWSGGSDTTAPTITISPSAGTFTSTQSVTLSGSDNSGGSVTIYYTTDGSTPTQSSSVYSSAISVSATTTIKYFGKDPSGNVSTVQTAAYTINQADVTAPIAVTGLAAGTPTATTVPLSWTLSSSGDVASQEVAYSTDGTNFTVASSAVNSASNSYTVTGLTASTAYTFRVIAVDAANNRSIAATTTATTAAPSVITTNLVAKYDSSTGSGTTTWADGIGSNTATLYNLAGTSASGFNGGLLVLDGTNDYADVVDSSSFTFGSGDFSIQMKLKFNRVGTAQVLFSQNPTDTANNSGVSVTVFMIGSNNITFRVAVGSTKYDFNSNVTITDTTSFHNVTIVRSGNTVYGYIDQVQVGSVAVSGVINDSPNKFTIGRWGEANSLYLGASIRALLVYNGKALTTSEMQINSDVLV